MQAEIYLQKYIMIPSPITKQATPFLMEQLPKQSIILMETAKVIHMIILIGMTDSQIMTVWT